MRLSADQRVAVLRGHAARFNLFVETGTADGYTTLALKDDFERLVTIEIDYDRYLYVATHTFLPYAQILPLWGDSGKVLTEVAYWIGEPALFWLDAHYSGGARGETNTPIVRELEAVATYSPGSAMLIDDARLFGTDPEYPALVWVEQWAVARGYEMTVKDDIIELVMPRTDP